MIIQKQIAGDQRLVAPEARVPSVRQSAKLIAGDWQADEAIRDYVAAVACYERAAQRERIAHIVEQLDATGFELQGH